MIIGLLLISFVISFVVCLAVALIFKGPLNRILQRLISDDIYMAWSKYMIFAIYVVGISGGVRIWDLEKYITPMGEDKVILELTSDRWVLEVYRTVIGTLQSIAWMLLVFFIFALIAYVILKGFELKKQAKA